MKLVLSLGFAALALQAQDARVTGVVQDTTGASVPDANLTLASQDRGVRRSVKTDAEGAYYFAIARPGNYKLTVRKEGFQTVSRTGIKLDVGQSARLDFTLQIGPVDQAITISADAPGVGTSRSDSPTVSTVIDRQFVEKLPLNGRSFQSLVALTPGVVLTKADFGEQGQFSVNGQRANANYFTVDGVSANIGVSAGLTLVQSASGSLPGLGATGGTNTLVSLESLQEFRVQTSGYAPEYGRMPGAQITMLTRSGTNDFHGSLFEFFRNNALDANDWFANQQSLPKPALRQSDFGGVLGGPVILPGIYDGKNRTFFFASYEGLRLRQPQVLATDVPSLSMRNLAGRSTLPFLDAFPVPNRPEGRFGFSQFVATYTDTSSLDATSSRLDHLTGSKVALFARYNHAPSNYTARLYALSNPTTTVVGTETATAGATVLFTPKLSSDLRLNYSFTTGESYSRLDNFGGAKPFDPSLFFPSSADPVNSFGGYFLQGGVNSSWYLGKNVANFQRQWNVVQTISYFAGAHQWKFGGDWRLPATTNRPRNYDLVVQFVGTFGAVFGQTAQTTVGAQEDITLYFPNLSLFAQDTWKASRRLTLTYGLRWEMNPAPYGSKQLCTYAGYENPRSLHVASAGTPLYETSYTSFAPRFGVAYQVGQSPGKEITVRAGFGLFYDLGAGIIGQSGAGFPYFRQRNFLTGTSFPVPEDIAAPPPFSLQPPTHSIYAAERGLRLPVTYQWNVHVDRALGGTNVVSIGSVGAAGRRLLRQEYFVNPNDNFTYAYLLRNRAFSDFHSLQAQFQRRLSSGLQTLVSYTWGKSLDNASTDSASHLIALQLDPNNDRGPSDFDIRQTLSAAFTYDFPRFRRQRDVISAAINNWALDGVFTARTATPVDVTFTRDLGFGLYEFRPDVIGLQPLYTEDPNLAGGRKLNYDAFEIQREFPGRQGTLGRNVLRGFGLQQFNLTVRREFPLVERARLQFRAEMFNVLNHPSFADPVGSLFSPQFGFSSRMLGRGLGRGGVNGGLNPLYQIGGPRSIQLALRIAF